MKEVGDFLMFAWNSLYSYNAYLRRSGEIECILLEWQ